MLQSNLAIIDIIRSHPEGISKRDIAPMIPLSWGGLCLAIKRAQMRGLIREAPSRRVARGRPCIPLKICPRSCYTIGVDVGSSFTRLLIADLKFRIVCSRRVPTPFYQGEEAFYDWLAGLIRDLTADFAFCDRICGVGISISGRVDSAEGVIFSGGNFGIPFGSHLQIDAVAARCGFDCAVVSSPLAAVCAEYYFGEYAGTPNMVNVIIGVGIGSGVISEDQLLLGGPRNSIGNIGHLLMPGNFHRCKNTGCNFVGCLEAYSGGASLCGIAREEFHFPDDISTGELDQLAANGDLGAQTLLNRAAEYNAIAVATMVQMYSPEVVILSGGQCQADGYLYNHTLQELFKRMPRDRQNFRIGLSRLGEYQPALGAARCGCDKFAMKG